MKVRRDKGYNEKIQVKDMIKAETGVNRLIVNPFGISKVL